MNDFEIENGVLKKYHGEGGNVIIPDGVKSIGNYAFNYCSSLASVIIPESVTSIGDYAFRNCSSLSSVTIPGSVASMGNGVFSDCKKMKSVTILDGVTKIEASTFWKCSNLTSVTIPASVKIIGIEAFAFCSSLTSVTIPESVTSIEEKAFEYSGLTSVIIPGGMKNIGKESFFKCESLTDVTIMKGVKRIETGTFAFCSKLTSVMIPDSVRSIGDNAFLFCGLTSVTIPESVTNIEDDAFNSCSNLTSVTIPGSVTSIGGEAFRGCKRLNDVTISNGVASIDIGAFAGCSMTEITIPDSVMSIGNYTFLYCSKLRKISINGSISKIDNNAFIREKDTSYLRIDKEELPGLTVIVRGKPGPALLKLFSKNRYQIDHIIFSDDLLCSDVPVYERKNMAIRIADTILQGNYISDKVYNSYLKYIVAHKGEWLDDSEDINSSVVELMLREKLIKITEIDSLIQKVSMTKNNKLLNLLMKYKQENFRQEDYDRQKIKMEKDARLRSDTTSQKYINAMWSVRRMEPYVKSFKGIEKTVVFPTRVGKTEVTGIADYFDFKGDDNARNKVEEIIIPEGYTYIGNEAFKRCTNLKTLRLPNSIKQIRWNVFASCEELIKVYIGSLEAWLKLDKSSIPMIYELYIEGKLVQDLVIPVGETMIQPNSFNGCTSLKKISFSSEVTDIGGQAFQDCSNLEDISIPNGVVSIGYCAFEGCKKLKTLDLPETVKVIDDFAFADSGITTLIVRSHQLNLEGTNILKKCQNFTIYAPKDSPASQYMPKQTLPLEALEKRTKKDNTSC